MTYLWTLAIRFIVLAHYINPFDIFLEWFYFVIQCYVASCCLWKVHLVQTREIPLTWPRSYNVCTLFLLHRTLMMTYLTLVTQLSRDINEDPRDS